MSLLTAALGGAGVAGGQIADDFFKQDAARDAQARQFQQQATLQQQAASIQHDRDALQQTYQQANIKATADSAVDVDQRKKAFDVSPDQVAGQAALVGSQTKAKFDATPLKLDAGQVVKDPVTGAVIARGEGITGAQATLQATAMRIARLVSRIGSAPFEKRSSTHQIQSGLIRGRLIEQTGFLLTFRRP